MVARGDHGDGLEAISYEVLSLKLGWRSQVVLLSATKESKMDWRSAADSGAGLRQKFG
jgi:hypothetical protein